MAGAVYKQCKYKGCKRSPRCDHAWWLSFSKGGHRHRMSAEDFAKKPVNSKIEAEEVWLPKFIAEVRAGRIPGKLVAAAEAMTVGRFVALYIRDHCRAEKLNMDSLEERLGVIQRHFESVELRALERPAPIETFKQLLMKKGLAAATVNRYLAQIRHMINWAIDRGYMESTPFRGRGRGVRFLREENHRTRRLKEGEELRILEAAADDPLMTARIVVALDTGMRRGEMLKLQSKHISWSQGTIRVPAQNAKSRKERQIPISTQRLRTVLEQRRFLKPDAFVLGDHLGEEQVDFRGAWERILRLAGISDRAKGLDGDLHWHDLRHECGSRLAERGVPLHEIQYLLGHASITTTQRYLNTTLEALKKSVQVLETERVAG